MSEYFDYTIQPIPLDKLKEYHQLAGDIAQVYRDHGATDYREFILDDPRTVGLPFPKMLQTREDETVVIAMATFPSREARDAAHKLIEADPRAAEIMDPDHPYLDYPRIAFGGFKELR